MGEPVPGAEIYVELEPDDQPIVCSETNESGEFSFSSLPQGVQLPECGFFQITVFPVIRLKPEKHIVEFKGKNPKFVIQREDSGKLRIIQVEDKS
ncbi:carboxypeptidase-like regulatory domain-containing protein [Chlorobium ferrooxidans]|uniref:carboxypeptidase-like regulatory domain-containing protein n=1 Tax=Chlorobium ferrooxidans TaxID=84205 RepID=UPI00058CF8AA|nr:carboxypeptidase-like regulatory domain-containing protein [Chlorobium ferrooxidans]